MRKRIIFNRYKLVPDGAFLATIAVPVTWYEVEATESF